MKSFLSWVGGKSRLAPVIVKQFPEHRTYVEVFGGAAWVLFRKELSHVEVYNDIDGQSWEKVIAAFDSPDTLFYLDPPYWIPGQKFYQHEFNQEHHQALRDLLATIEGKFVLSYNESKAIRKLYRGFRVRSTGPAHYSGNNNRSSARMKRELIIRNF